VDIAPEGEEASPGEAADTAEDGATDLAVSVVTLDPTVECARGILAAFGAALGAKMLAAFEVVGVEGAAVGGEEIEAP
jgi:hypothetical protein